MNPSTVDAVAAARAPGDPAGATPRSLASWIALTAAAYFGFALVSLMLSAQPGSVATLWYANAVAVCMLVARRQRDWPVLLLTVAAANTAANLMFRSSAWLTLAFIPGNLTEILVGAHLLRRYCVPADCVSSVGMLLKAVALGGIVPALVGALLGASTLAALGLAPFEKAWFLWFVGSGIGSVSVLPLGLFLLARGGRALVADVSRPHALSTVLVALTVACAVPAALPFPYIYIAVALLVVATVGSFAAVAVAVLLCSMAVGTLIAGGVFQAPAGGGHFSEAMFYLPLMLTLLLPMFLAATLERLKQKVEQLADREAHLESARRDLKNILDAVPSLIGYWDASMRNRFANHAHQAWFGVDPARMPGMAIGELMGSRFELNRPHIEAALRGEPQTFERSIPRPDGAGERHALSHLLPDRVDGQVRGFYAIVHDITRQTRDKARLAAALRENEALLGTLHKHSIVSITDRAGRITEVNDRFCAISGYGRDELLGQNHRIINSGMQSAEFWVDLWRSVGAGQAWRGEICNRAKDGSLYWVDSMIAPFIGDDGRIEKYISIRNDVSAAKRSELSLAQERHLMTTLLETVPDQIYFKDLDSRFLRINPGLARRFGLMDPAQARGTSDADYFSAAHARQTQAIERRIVDSGQPVLDLEEQEIWPDRAPTWNLTTKMPLRDAEGRIVGIFGISRDITARKETEAQLVQTNERFAMAADAAGIGVWDFEVRTKRLVWDDWMHRLYGVPRGEDPPTLWERGVHPDDREQRQAQLDAALDGGSAAYSTEFRVIRPDGEVRNLKALARVLRDANGAPVRMTGVNFDITERKQAELALLETSTLLHTVLASSSEVAVIATDPALHITVFNHGAQRLLGYVGDEVVGQATPLLFHDADELRSRGRELGAQLGRAVEGVAVLVEPSTLRQPREWTYVRKDGRRVSVSLVMTAMQSDAGGLLGYLGIAHDVTRQKQHEESLRIALHEAREANQAKSRFLANMSHEIRTPMNAVIGLSYLLGKTPLNPPQLDFLDKIKVASKSLLAVINDVLDLSKIEAGEMLLERAAFSLSGLLAELASMLSVQADAKGIGFEIDVPDWLPTALSGDAARLSQILTNLLANAIKFTDRGGVRLSIRQLAARAGGVSLRFSVRDSGIGIAPEHQPRLFAPFVQADASTTRRFGGTGLGLSIVKRLAGLMGGDVGLSSTPGEGSEFWVVLDFALAASDELPAPQTVPAELGRQGLAGLRVLVVDDSDINLEVAQRMLEFEGARVTLADNGQKAFEQLQARPKAFDVVLMDVHMPVLDGHQATRRIRIELGLTALPIIALTADVLTTERQLTAASGMDDFISKPFDPQALVRSIRRHVRAAGAAAVPPGLPVRPPRPPVAAVAATPWPRIEGIDADEARSRLCGEWGLFRSILKRLLDEFCELDIPSPGADAGRLAAHAATMHKLRGSAGQLGAREIYQLAGEAEAACRAGQGERGAELTRRLQGLLQRMRQSAMPVLAASQALPQPVAPGAADVADPRVVVDLIALLRQQNLAALDRFGAASPQLLRLLGAAAFEGLREHVDNLRFDDAAATLQARLG